MLYYPFLVSFMFGKRLAYVARDDWQAIDGVQNPRALSALAAYAWQGHRANGYRGWLEHIKGWQ